MVGDAAFGSISGLSEHVTSAISERDFLVARFFEIIYRYYFVENIAL